MIFVDGMIPTGAKKSLPTRLKRRSGREKASIKALRVGKQARTFAQIALRRRYGYRWFAPLVSARGNEYKGIVDIVAVKRDKKDHDHLEIALVQVKGGGARITSEEINRLKDAKRKLSKTYVVAEKPKKSVVLRDEVGI
jgi:hypothetical protein